MGQEKHPQPGKQGQEQENCSAQASEEEGTEVCGRRDPGGQRQGGQGGFGLGQCIIPGWKPAQEDPEPAQQKQGQDQLPVGLLFWNAQGS